MSFADWKKCSKRFASLLSRLQVHGTEDVLEVCQAAYKAGERQGRKDAEAVAKQAIELYAMTNEAYDQERQTDATLSICVCKSCGRAYYALLRCPRCGAPRV